MARCTKKGYDPLAARTIQRLLNKKIKDEKKLLVYLDSGGCGC